MFMGGEGRRRDVTEVEMVGRKGGGGRGERSKRGGLEEGGSGRGVVRGEEGRGRAGGEGRGRAAQGCAPNQPEHVWFFWFFWF